MLTLVSHYLVERLLVGWVDLFGGPRVSAIGDAARGNPESAAGDGAPNAAALVDGHGGETLDDMTAANRAAIC